MKAGLSFSKFLVLSQTFVFLIFTALPMKALAEYYVESEPVPVVECATCSPYAETYAYYPQRHYYHHHAVHHHYYHHVRHHRHSSYSIEVYYVWHVPPPPPPPCGYYGCGDCSPCGSCYHSCGGGCHVSSCGGCYGTACHRARVYYAPQVVYVPPPSEYDDSPDFDTRTADDFNAIKSGLQQDRVITAVSRYRKPLFIYG